MQWEDGYVYTKDFHSCLKRYKNKNKNYEATCTTEVLMIVIILIEAGAGRIIHGG